MNRSHRISMHVNYKVAQSLAHSYNHRGEEVASRNSWVVSKMIVNYILDDIDGDDHVVVRLIL